MFNFPSSSGGQMPPNNQINMIKAMLSASGMSAEQLVRKTCEERGINVDEFMKQFKK